jgi:hypothetical protein
MARQRFEFTIEDALEIARQSKIAREKMKARLKERIIADEKVQRKLNKLK